MRHQCSACRDTSDPSGAPALLPSPMPRPSSTSLAGQNLSRNLHAWTGTSQVMLTGPMAASQPPAAFLRQSPSLGTQLGSYSIYSLWFQEFLQELALLNKIPVDSSQTLAQKLKPGRAIWKHSHHMFFKSFKESLHDSPTHRDLSFLISSSKYYLFTSPPMSPQGNHEHQRCGHSLCFACFLPVYF